VLFCFPSVARLVGWLVGSLDWAHTTRDNAVSKKMERDREAAAQAKGGGGGSNDDVSLYRREMAVIHFSTKHRPAPHGVRGMEVCIPNPFLPSTVGGSSSSSSQPSSSQQNPIFNIVKPFERIRLAGKQNKLFAKSCIVYHEKASK
jgi:hypothetical protein